MNPFKVHQAAIRSAKTDRGRWQIDDIELHTAGYKEPGYHDPESGFIATGNWNDFTHYEGGNPDTYEGARLVTDDDTPSRLAEIFGKMGVEIEWSDEWDACEECRGLVRTSPDSYSWTPSYVRDEYQFVCVECLDEAEHLLQLEGNPRTLNQISSIDPGEHGYLLVQKDFEHGMHRGMDADPILIAKLLQDTGCTRYLFNQDEQSQFYMGFSVWLHKDEEGLLKYAQEAVWQGKTDGPSVAGAMERGLREASAQGDALRAQQAETGGVIYSKVGPDGATTTLVSPEDFVAGKLPK